MMTPINYIKEVTELYTCFFPLIQNSDEAPRNGAEANSVVVSDTCVIDGEIRKNM